MKKLEEIEKIELNEADEDILEVREIVKISDGAHSGKISKVIKEARGEQGEYIYLDVYITTKDDNGKDIDIKAGFPYYLSEASGLGTLLKRAGLNFKAGDKIKSGDIYNALKGKKVIFQTYTEETDKGTFSRIIEKTIKFD
jgi:hypothetical protein